MNIEDCKLGQAVYFMHNNQVTLGWITSFTETSETLEGYIDSKTDTLNSENTIYDLESLQDYFKNNNAEDALSISRIEIFVIYLTVNANKIDKKYNFEAETFELNRLYLTKKELLENL